jgi:hypothetical protein
MSKMFAGHYILGGIESRDIDRLAEALLADAAQSDNAASPVCERSRNVNTEELRRIAARILGRTLPTKDDLTCRLCGASPAHEYNIGAGDVILCEPCFTKASQLPPSPAGEGAQETHRCSGCGHHWDGPIKGAELCGDCWRRAQPVLHSAALPPEQVALVEPESVAHWLCPRGVGGEAPVMRIVQRRDDVAGSQRRYVCPRCEMEITVNFPPPPERVALVERLKASCECYMTMPDTCLYCEAAAALRGEARG